MFRSLGSTEYRIWLTQVGDPLAHGQYDLVHGISPNGVTGGSLLSVAHSIDDEEAEPGFRVRDITEGRGDAHFLTEVAPPSKGCRAGASGLGSGGFGGERESKLEVSLKAALDGNWSIFQGRSCGYFCWK